MGSIRSTIDNLTEIAADTPVTDTELASLDLSGTAKNVVPTVVNTVTTSGNLSLGTVVTVGSSTQLYTGNGANGLTLPTQMQVANDNGDGVTAVQDWTSVASYTVGDVAIDNSATGDARAYTCLVNVSGATSPVLDTVNWKLTTDQYGGKFHFKNRTGTARSHLVYDSVRRETRKLSTDTTSVEEVDGNGMYLISPFSVSVNGKAEINTNGSTYVLWIEQTTRKTAGYRTDAGVMQNSKNNTGTDLMETDSVGQPQIRHYNPTTKFEIVMDTGTGVAGRSITTEFKYKYFERKALIGAISDWYVFNTNEGATKFTRLNTTVASTTGAYWNDSEPTDSTATFGSDTQINGSTRQYITYGYGDSELRVDKIYQGTGIIGNEIDLGLDMRVAGAKVVIKRLDSAGNWIILDSTRDTDGVMEKYLYFDTSGAEVDNTSFTTIATKVGVRINSTITGINASGGTYLIRATVPSYSKPISGEEINFNSALGFVGANGKNSNNALVVSEGTTTSSSLLDVGTDNENTTQYLFTDSVTQTKSNSSVKMNSGISRKDADKFGEYTDSRELTKTTARHGTYASETGVVSASGELATNYSYTVLNKNSLALGSQSSGWLVATPTGWWQVKLKEGRKLDSWRMATSVENGTDSNNIARSPKRFVIEGSNDGVTWSDVDATYKETTGIDYVASNGGLFADLNVVNATLTYSYFRILITQNGGDGTYTGFDEIEFNFAISDALYLNTTTNEVLDSTDTKVNLVPIGEVKVDSQGNTYDLVEYDANQVHMNDINVHGIIVADNNTVLLTNKNSVLPDLVTINKRYILDNPFGDDVPVDCVVELFYNGVWAKATFIYSAGGLGTHSAYVEGIGVIITTGGSFVLSGDKASSGASHGGTANLTTAPCRVRVTRIGGK